MFVSSNINFEHNFKTNYFFLCGRLYIMVDFLYVQNFVDKFQLKLLFCSPFITF